MSYKKALSWFLSECSKKSIHKEAHAASTALIEIYVWDKVVQHYEFRNYDGKMKRKSKVTLEQASEAHRRNRGIGLLVL